MNSSEDSNAFRLRLSLAIAESGKTKAQIAREIGETSQLLNKWLNTDQQRLPSANYVVKLAEVLKVNLLWLITGEGSRKSNLLSPVDGDCILIDCSKIEKIENGAIYAIAYDHELMVKRLIKEFGKLIIKSENPAYHDVVLEAEAANRVYIIGRVIERPGVL